jgi:hypothetical protein
MERLAIRLLAERRYCQRRGLALAAGEPSIVRDGDLDVTHRVNGAILRGERLNS